ncbi:MAG: hypothetical protein DRJ10_13645 [Bacteroidetes bacterium]|nr:MAG: hypothetical protein DRJ10_13645 [Bacteroidota bacterium]
MEKIINDFYEVEVNDSLAIIFIKKDVFRLLTTGTESELLLNTLDILQFDPKIKALLFLNTPECYGEKIYDSFLKEIMLFNKESKDIEIPAFCNDMARHREINILNRFVQYLANYKKLCFTVLSGSIVTPFIGASLATDIRYATPEMFFSFAHNKYGLHPSGGLPYFLTHQLGYNKALEIIFSEKITSKEALKLGLINKIVPRENLVEFIINKIEKITQFRSCTLRRTKQLSAYAHNSLSDYFTYEGSLLNL